MSTTLVKRPRQDDRRFDINGYATTHIKIKLKMSPCPSP